MILFAKMGEDDCFSFLYCYRNKAVDIEEMEIK